MIFVPRWEQELDAMLKGFGVLHFTARELAKSGDAQRIHGPIKDVPRELWRNIIPTAMVAEWARIYVGVPLVVLSGYRDGAYNARIGGASDSMHKLFNALDLHPKGVSPLELYRALEGHPDAAKFGLGFYPNNGFVHVDTRGLIGRSAPKRW